jgi:putative transposase
MWTKANRGRMARPPHHLSVDTGCRLLMVNLTTADVSDSAGAQAILDAIRNRLPRIKHLFADDAYDRRKLMDKAVFKDFVIEIVGRIDSDPSFRCFRADRWLNEPSAG